MGELDTIDAKPAWVVIAAIVLTIAGALTGRRWNKVGIGVLLGALTGPLFFAAILVWQTVRGGSP